MTSVTYPNKRAYIGNRPYGDIVFPSGSRPTYKALVDTGADYLQVPAAAATLAGISLAAGSSHSVTTAAGTSVSMTLVKSISVEIEASR